MAIKRRYPPLKTLNQHQHQERPMERPRDHMGRFVQTDFSNNTEELPSKSDKPLNLVKVKNSYGSYQVKKTEELDPYFIIVTGLFLTALFFKI